MAVVIDGTTGITAPAVDAGNDVGQVAMFAMSTAPAGWLKANGAAISRTTYADLFAAIGTTYGTGDGSTTFNLPDMRGEFVRGWDDGRGVDTDRVMGSSQEDAFQGHWHEKWYPSTARYGGGTYAGVDYTGHNVSAQHPTDYQGLVRNAKSDGINGATRTAAETRPRNVAVLVCIKY